LIGVYFTSRNSVFLSFENRGNITEQSTFIGLLAIASDVRGRLRPVRPLSRLGVRPVGNRLPRGSRDWDSQGYEGVVESSIKKYDAQIHTQSAIHCMIELARRHSFDPSKVVSIEEHSRPPTG
jgi:hypothetical protein